MKGSYNKPLIEHIVGFCAEASLAAAGIVQATNPDIPPDILIRDMFLQGYLNGLIEGSELHGLKEDHPNYEYLAKLKLLLIPVRIEVQARLRQLKEEADKEKDSRNRHRNNGS